MTKKKQQNGVFTGRQVIWSIYDHYRRRDCNVTMYGYEDLGKIEWLGDECWQMAKFLEILRRYLR